MDSFNEKCPKPSLIEEYHSNPPSRHEQHPADIKPVDEPNETLCQGRKDTFESLLHVGRPSGCPPGKPRKPLIEEISTSGVQELETPKEGIRENANSFETVGSTSNQGELSSTNGSPSWEALQELAQRVGSTFDREPFDLNKEKREFLKGREQNPDSQLGGLD